MTLDERLAERVVGINFESFKFLIRTSLCALRYHLSLKALIQNNLTRFSLLERVCLGQDQAVKVVADCVRTSRAGLHFHSKPIGAFFFLGPTGVGRCCCSSWCFSSSSSNTGSCCCSGILTEFL